MKTNLFAALFLVFSCGLEPGANGPTPSTTSTTSTSIASLSQVTGFGSNPGGLNMYLYAPAHLPTVRVPVVVAMHGCTQTAADYMKAGWNDLADQVGFVVVYPEATTNNDCFGWYDPAQARRGQGQTLSIKQMIEETSRRYNVGDVYVTGLSAGAAMTSVMLAAYPEVFSAGAIMSGIAYRCADSQNDAYTCMFSSKSFSAAQWGDLIRGAAPSTGSFPRVGIWQGTSDYTVTKGNADEILAQWTNVHGISTSPSHTETVGPATHNAYATADGVVQVEEWLISGMGHGTAVDPSNGCGTAGAYILDVGLCSTRESAKFFGLTGATGGNSGAGGGSAAAGGGSAGTGGNSGAGGGSASPGGTGGGMAMTGGTGGGSTPPISTCTEVNATNYAHTQAGRAALCSPVNGHACAVGSNDDLGLWNLYNTSWVRQTSPGYYELGRCP